MLRERDQVVGTRDVVSLIPERALKILLGLNGKGFNGIQTFQIRKNMLILQQ